MKILIEEYAYSPEDVRNALPDGRIMLTDEKIKIEHVGYYHNSNSTKEQNDDFVFFLPKVLLNEKGRVFAPASDPNGGFAPEEIIDPEKVNETKALTDGQKDFLYEFAVWIYRCISHFAETHPGTDAVWRKHDAQSGAFKRKYVTNTLLDVILALLRFERENENYFLFKIKECHSGLNRINWARTISGVQPVMQDGRPLYLSLVNKRRVIDYDEELLVIFYSILNYAKEHFGFKVRAKLAFQLIKGEEFNRYLDGLGKIRLRQIKYKYFADRDLSLWELCFAFFDRAHQAVVSGGSEEYLLAKNFEIIFEAMVDELLGDVTLDKFKELRDGKEIDHLYIDDSIVRRGNFKSLYIADSKYYRIGNALGPESVAKQFTYAKDVLQLDLNLFLFGEDAVQRVKNRRAPFESSGLGLIRDPETEGYDVIPNFFISAAINEELDYDRDNLNLRHLDDGREYRSVHFENRLFDRDTLILSHYDVNFLFILKLYAQNDEDERTSWKEEVRSKFKKEIRTLIGSHFEFRAIMPHDGIDPDVFFHENFKHTLGKVYPSYPMIDDKRVYSLALELPDQPIDDHMLSKEGKIRLRDRVVKENAETLELIRSAFYVTEPVKLGEDPSEELRLIQRDHPVIHRAVSDSESGVQVVAHVSGSLINAVKVSGRCVCPVSQCLDPESVKMLVLPYTRGAHLFRVVGKPERRAVGDLPGAFANIMLPENECWMWSVEGVDP